MNLATAANDSSTPIVLTHAIANRLARVNDLCRDLRDVGIHVMRTDVAVEPPRIEIRRDRAVSIAPLLNLAAPRDLYWTDRNTQGHVHIRGVHITWSEIAPTVTAQEQ